MTRRDLTLPFLVVLALVLTLAAGVLPGWVRFVTQLSLAVGLVSLGLMVLMRAGLVSFGQGLYYCLGGYSVALAGRAWGLSDAFGSVLLGAAVAAAVAAVVGFLIVRYRQIFFAMLTLALSMIAYGVLLKVEGLRGTDGLNVGAVSFAGYRPSGDSLQVATFIFSCWIAAVVAGLTHLYLSSTLGQCGDAIRENELRLEFLGLSVRATVHVKYVIAGTSAGVGGVLTAISARHVDPGFAFWTTGGEFVFVVLIGGQRSVLAPFLGAGFLEFLRSFAAEWASNAWQLILGSIMLAVVMFLPDGLWSALRRIQLGVKR